MARFCGYCGASSEGGKFCTTCGQPFAEPPAPSEPVVSEPETTRVRPMMTPPAGSTYPPAPPAQQQYDAPPPAYQQPTYQQPTYQQPSYQQPAYQQPGYPQPSGAAPVRASVPAVNPFTGVPVSDYVRDGAALFCLFAALGMPWDLLHDAADRWWVTISVLLAALALSVPYIGKSRVIPGWTHTHVVLVKSIACVPLLASVVAVLVNELVHVTDDYAGGIGTGVGMALAGVGLVVQPRAAQEEHGDPQERFWTSALNVLAVATTVVGLAAFVAFFLDDLTGGGYLTDDPMTLLRLIVLVPLMFAVVVGWPALGTLGGSPAWRRVLATSAFTMLGVALLALGSDGDGLFGAAGVERWNSAYAGTFLVGLTAALAVSRPAHRRSSSGTDPVSGWIATAASALMVAGVAFVVSVISLVLEMVDAKSLQGELVAVVVLMLISAGAVATALSMLGDVRRNRSFVLAALGVVLLLSVISIGLLGSRDNGNVVGGWTCAMWFSLPVLALWALLVPEEVRRALGPLVPQGAATAPYGGPPPSYVAPPPGYVAQPPGGPYQYPGPPPAGPPPAGPPAGWPQQPQ